MRRDKTFPSIEKTVLASLVLSSSLSLATSVSAQVIQVVANFNKTNGFLPYGSLTLGSNGLFYGTANSGGNGSGTIFAFNPATNALTDLANFNGGNGAEPYGSLTLGSNGLFYGTAGLGGINGDGTIFAFNPANNAIIDLGRFNGTNGAEPVGSLTLGSNSLFYGTTELGGTNGDGTIFSFNPANNTLTDLANFNGANGEGPSASLTLGSNGLFYGTTELGGTNGDGTIFSFNPANNALTELANFNGTNGEGPSASLTLGSNGLFYGTAEGGGTNQRGTIFAFNPATNALTDLANFTLATTGAAPFASLTLGSNGLFYGTTTFGGNNGYGTLFAFNPATNTLTDLANFDDLTTGADGSGNLTLGSNGLIYGATQYGGTYGYGTIFAFNPGISSTPVPEPDENLALGVTVLGAIAFLKRQITKAINS